MKRKNLFIFNFIWQLFIISICSGQSIVWERVLGPTPNVACRSIISTSNNMSIILTQLGEIYRSEDNGNTWIKSTISLYDRSFSYYSLIVSNQEAIFASSPSGLYRSVDLGKTWENLQNTAWALAVDINGRIYKSGGGSEITFSNDQGNTWSSPIFLDFATMDPVTKIEVLFDQTIIAVTEINNKVFISNDQGQTWNRDSNPLFSSRITCISKPIDGYTFLAIGSNIYTASNENPTWKMITSLPNGPIFSFGKNNQGDIFAVTPESVYQTDDFGRTWLPANTGLETGGLSTISITKNDVMYIGTNYYWNGYGPFSSLFRSTSLASVEFISQNLLNKYDLKQNYPNPFNNSTIIEYYVPMSSFIEIKLYNELGKEIQLLLSEKKGPGIYSLHFDSHNLSSEIYYYQIKAGAFCMTKCALLIR
jgi:photosystem II stability/assembly factor-like uncharacterized protein